MRRFALLLLISVLLAGCGNPKDQVIPRDLSKLDQDKEFIETVKSLPQEDKDLLTGYVARALIAQAFNQSPPIGRTVGEAIENQKAWVKEQQQIEQQKEVAKQKALAEFEKQSLELQKALQLVYLKRVGIKKANYQEYVQLAFDLKNNSGKEISGYKADLKFKDQFGNEFKTLTIEDSDGLKANFDDSIVFAWQYNQFDDGWQKLLSLDEAKFKVDSQVTHVIFTDGTELKI